MNKTTIREWRFIISFSLITVMAGTSRVRSLNKKKKKIARRQGPVSICIFRDGCEAIERENRLDCRKTRVHVYFIVLSKRPVSPLLHFSFLPYPARRLKVEHLCKSGARAHLAHGNSGVESKI